MKVNGAEHSLGQELGFAAFRLFGEVVFLWLVGLTTEMNTSDVLLPRRICFTVLNILRFRCCF